MSEYITKVGEECEYATGYDNYTEWFPCTVLFIGKDIIVFNDGKHEQPYSFSRIKFRPIQTERDLFIEEYIKQVSSIVATNGPFLYSLRCIAARLYDAGFRRIKP